jgi:hypothetical protein
MNKFCWIKEFIYEGESVNRSQMDIQRKTCDIRTWKKHLFLDISSANTDTLVPSLHQCVEIHGIEIFWLMSQSLPYLRFNALASSGTFATQLWTALCDKFVPPWTGNIYLWKSFALSPFAKKIHAHNRTLLFGRILLKHGGLKLTSEHAHERLLRRLSWSWTVLLPSNKHRKPITSITAALLPFVTYLQTLLHKQYDIVLIKHTW